MSIEELCEKYGITNYTINSDDSINVNGDVDLKLLTITKLPLKFGSVSGYFDCPLGLTTLEGSPKSVGGNFNCSRNKLTDLKGCPKSIGGWFECRYNEILTLEGIPESIGNNSIGCGSNPIYSIFQENVNILKKSTVK